MKSKIIKIASRAGYTMLVIATFVVIGAQLVPGGMSAVLMKQLY